MNTLKKLAYAGAATAMTAQHSVFAQLNLGQDKAKTLEGAKGQDAAGAIMGVITTLLTFVTIIAVAYALYGGFMIMTAGGDDERAKKGRKLIIQVLIGITVMWLAYAIVTLVVNALSK